MLRRALEASALKDHLHPPARETLAAAVPDPEPALGTDGRFQAASLRASGQWRNAMAQARVPVAVGAQA
eukprot:701855-Rhodomonas_salina.1